MPEPRPAAHRDQLDGDGARQGSAPGPLPRADLEGLGDLERAAVEAELRTGDAETSVEEAKRHILVRIGIVAAGTFVVLIGGLLLVLPGPGWLVIFAGLLILSSEVPFAARMLESVRRRLPQDADGKLPRSAIVTMVLVFLAATAASVWWTLLR